MTQPSTIRKGKRDGHGGQIECCHVVRRALQYSTIINTKHANKKSNGLPSISGRLDAAAGLCQYPVGVIGRPDTQLVARLLVELQLECLFVGQFVVGVGVDGGQVDTCTRQQWRARKIDYNRKLYPQIIRHSIDDNYYLLRLLTSIEFGQSHHRPRSH